MSKDGERCIGEVIRNAMNDDEKKHISELLNQIEYCDFECIGGNIKRNIAFRKLVGILTGRTFCDEECEK